MAMDEIDRLARAALLRIDWRYHHAALSDVLANAMSNGTLLRADAVEAHRKALTDIEAELRELGEQPPDGQGFYLLR